VCSGIDTMLLSSGSSALRGLTAARSQQQARSRHTVQGYPANVGGSKHTGKIAAMDVMCLAPTKVSCLAEILIQLHW
jgi:hypothetical protein